MRVLSSGCIAWLLLLSACGANPAAPGSAAAGSGSGGASGASTTESGGAAGASAPGVAGASTSAGGTSSAGGATAANGGAPAARAGAGGGDDGDLFDPGMSVPLTAAGGAVASTAGAGGGASQDGTTVTSSIGGKASGSATFTQNGVNVDVKLTLSSCPNGVLGIHINDGDSCDNTGTEGKPWDGKRGNIGDTGSITCANGKASLTYTRLGTDPTTNWTIGDHNLKTDITSYVVIVSTNADGTNQSSFIGCGNFFK